MSVTRTTVGMISAAVVVIAAVGMPVHAPILRAQDRPRSQSTRLLGSLTTGLVEWIDGLGNGCHDETSLWPSVGCCTSPLAREYGGCDHKIEFLGRARLHANSGSCHVALWRQHALPGAGSPGRYATHIGLRHWVAHAGQPLGRCGREQDPGNAHPDHALSLGSHSRCSLLCAAVRREE